MAYLEHPSPWLAIGGIAIIGTAVALSRLQGRIQPASGRLAALDGLRGLLALAVFSHHFFIAYQWKHNGRWESPPTHLYSLMGSGSVTVFFMITGFLFFGRIKAVRGAIDLNAFFVGRVFRLLPVYLLAVALVFGAALLKARTPWSTAFRPALDGWLMFRSDAIASDSAAGLIDAGVHWTLAYEWLFYLALPVLAFAWTGLRCASWVLFWLSAAMIILAYGNPAIPGLGLQSLMLAPFALGGLVGEVGRARPLRHALQRWPGALLSALSAAAALVICDTAYSVTGFLLLALAFAPIALGNTLFGLLRTRTLMMLGEISYSVYLLHGLVIFGLYSLLMPNALDRAGTSGRLFSLLLIAGFCTVAAAVAAHLLVERPFIRLGRRLVRIDRIQELAAP